MQSTGDGLMADGHLVMISIYAYTYTNTHYTTAKASEIKDCVCVRLFVRQDRNKVQYVQQFMARGMGTPLLLLAASPPLLVLLLSSSCVLLRSARGLDLLTQGFTAVNLSEAQFVVQKPYDVPLSERYEFVNGVRRMWVYNTDHPITTSHPGGPRTEIKINLIYNSGVWQFEGYGYIPCGTTGASVMQIFGAAGTPHATTLMLHVYDGQLTYYHHLNKVVADHVYDRWFRLNVVHDVVASNITVFVDGEQRLTAPGRGTGPHYFKFGVYGQWMPSHRMESWWRDVKVFTK